MYADHISQLDQFTYRLKAVIHSDMDSILEGLRPLMPQGDRRLTSAVNQLNECLNEIMALAQERLARVLGAHQNGRQKNKHALAARDLARAQLRQRLILLRQWVEGLYGQRGLDLLYINAKTPERPDFLVTYAELVMSGLSDPKIQLPKAQIPMILDRELWVSELQALRLALVSANDQLAENQASLAKIKRERLDEYDQLHKITRAVSHLLKGQLLLADQSCRIRHLKKVRRKRPQAQPNEGLELIEVQVATMPQDTETGPVEVSDIAFREPRLVLQLLPSDMRKQNVSPLQPSNKSGPSDLLSPSESMHYATHFQDFVYDDS